MAHDAVFGLGRVDDIDQYDINFQLNNCAYGKRGSKDRAFRFREWAVPLDDKFYVTQETRPGISVLVPMTF